MAGSKSARDDASERTNRTKRPLQRNSTESSSERTPPAHSLQRAMGNQAVQKLHRRGDSDVGVVTGQAVDKPERANASQRDVETVTAARRHGLPERSSEGSETAAESVSESRDGAEHEDHDGDSRRRVEGGTGRDEEARGRGSVGNEREEPSTLDGEVQGEQLLQRFRAYGIQAKLRVGARDDTYEREAESVARAVSASLRPSAPLEQSTSSGNHVGIQGRVEGDDPNYGLRTTEASIAPSDARELTAETAAPLRTIRWRTLSRPSGSSTREDDVLPPMVSPRTAGTIQNPSVGRPLPGGVRDRIEAHLGVSLDEVDIHTGSSAKRAAGSLGARAFTHRNHIFLGAGESPYDMRLMAHEATHVVQQGAVPDVEPSSNPPADVQRFVPDWALEKLSDYARYIPGWDLFTVVIGKNPLTDADVERTPTNLVRGLLGLLPVGGPAIFDALQEYGVLQEAFEWIRGQLRNLNLSLSRIRGTIEAAWEDVNLAEGLEYNIEVLRRHFGGLYADVERFALSLVDRVVQFVKDAVVDVAEWLLSENRAWSLIKKILGRDPLRGTDVEATPTEILEDFLLLIGQEQHLEVMRREGTVEETAEWLASQIGRFRGLLGQLGALISRAWEAIKPENILDLSSTIEMLVADVGTFLQDIWDFASTVANEVLKRIKNALLGALSRFANKVPGFELLTVIIEKNPFTGAKVLLTAENLIRGFFTLLPGGVDVYQQLSETGLIPQAAARIEGAMEELGISWEFVVGLFSDIWESLSIEDLVDPVSAFTRVVERFGDPLSRLFGFVNMVLREMFFVVLEAMNFPSDLLDSIVSNVVLAIEDIKQDPIGFLTNMLTAVKLGFENFFGDIVGHLSKGLADWLFRGLSKAGIEPPTDLSLQSVLEFVLTVLGISIDRIWELLADRIGRENVDRVRGVIDRLSGALSFVRDVQERGIGAIWEYIESQVGGLWDMVLSKAQEWIMERVVNRATKWLVSLLDPTGVTAIINSFQAFFKAIESAAEYARDILSIVNDYASAIAGVAKGSLEAGAEKLEQGLANAIPVAIGFLAKQFGLDNIGDQIKELVGGVRGLVDRALDWLVEKAVGGVQSLLRTLGVGEAESRADDRKDEVDATDHVAVAQRVVEQLREVDASDAYQTVREQVAERATQLERYWSARLERGIGLSVILRNERDSEDNDIDFEVVVAPNTVRTQGAVNLDQATEAPANLWEAIAAETMEDYLSGFQNWRRPRSGKEAGQTLAVPVQLSDHSVQQNRRRAEHWIDQSPASQTEMNKAKTFVNNKITAAAKSQEEATVYRRLREAATRIQNLYGGRVEFGLDVEHLTEVAQNPELFPRTRISRKYTSVAARIKNGTPRPGTPEAEIASMAVSAAKKREIARLYAEQLVDESLGTGETVASTVPVEIELEIITEAAHKAITARRAAERAESK